MSYTEHGPTEMFGTYKCYSAGPGLFPRVFPDGRVETWDEAEARVRKLNSVIDEITEFESITPTNADLTKWGPSQQSRACLLKDLLLASQCDIVFADVTPFCGAEPDSGTVVEATTCALNGKLLVLWADPLQTYAEKFATTVARPQSELDDHNNLMLEQLFYLSWGLHFGQRHSTFNGLKAAVVETARQIRLHGLTHVHPLILDRMNKIGYTSDLHAAVGSLPACFGL